MKSTIKLLVLLLAGKTALAATLSVPSQYSTIQSAIVAASVGDTVLVTPNNIYYENIDFIGKDITVKTPNPPADRFTTVIDGNHNGTVVKFINLETQNARLQGFTIQNGTGTVHDWWYYLGVTKLAGGGILCDGTYPFTRTSPYKGSSPSLSYLIVENNTAQNGAGICAWYFSTPLIENTIVRKNTASELAGGLYLIEAFNLSGTKLPLTNVEVTHNVGGTLGGSGVVVNYSTEATLMNCTLADNTAGNTSGEALFRANNSHFTITNSIIWNLISNLLYDQGGAYQISSIGYSDVTNTLGPITIGFNVILTDPVFANPGADDYHLNANSPCINAGDTLNAPLYDLDGHARNGNPDLGAYEVSAAPIALFQTSDTIICENNCINLTNLSTGAISWQWNFVGANPPSSTAENPQQICYPASGDYDITLIASNGVGRDTVTLSNYIVVHPSPPSPVITISNDTLFCGTDSSYTSYQWYYNSGLILGATKTFLAIFFDGNYNIKVINSNNCETASGINIVLGLQNLSNDNIFSLYPNPVSNQLTIHLSSVSKNDEINVSITNVLGQMLYQSAITTPLSEIDISTFPSGLYFAKVMTNKGGRTEKFIKQ